MIRMPALTLVLAALVAGSGCASSGGIAPGQEFSLDTGAQARLPDASVLRYVGIANDSRCPPKVVCIRAGDADVLFDHSVDRGPAQRVVLNTESASTVPLGAAWTLHLRQLDPGDQPRVTLRLEAR
jgi:hypothetical protein